MHTVTATILASTVAFLSLIQPCPAPPLAIGLAAGTTLGAGAAIGGAAVSGGVGHRKRDTEGEFDDCITKSLYNKQQIQFQPDNKIAVTGIPPPCMDEINAYNSHANLQDLQIVHGKTSVTGKDSVLLENMPEYILTSIRTIYDAPNPSQPAPKTVKKSFRWGSAGAGDAE